MCIWEDKSSSCSRRVSLESIVTAEQHCACYPWKRMIHLASDWKELEKSLFFAHRRKAAEVFQQELKIRKWASVKDERHVFDSRASWQCVRFYYRIFGWFSSIESRVRIGQWEIKSAPASKSNISFIKRSLKKPFLYQKIIKERKK